MRTAALGLTAAVLILAAVMTARRLIREIPFDVAVWGDLKVTPTDQDELDAAIADARAGNEPDWYKELAERAKEIRREDLDAV